MVKTVLVINLLHLDFEFKFLSFTFISLIINTFSLYGTKMELLKSSLQKETCTVDTLPTAMNAS